MFVAGDHRVGLPAFDRDRDDLLVEHTAILGSDGFRMGGGRERVLRGAGDLVIAPKVLGRLQHATRHREILAASREAASDQAVVHSHVALAEAPTPVGGIKRRIAHRLSAARDNTVHSAGGDLHGRIDDRLQAGAATPVDLHAADFDRQARIERDHAAKRRRVHRRITLRKDHIVHLVLRQAGARHQSFDNCRAEHMRVDILERAAEAADRRADRFTDHDIAHGFLPVLQLGW